MFRTSGTTQKSDAEETAPLQSAFQEKVVNRFAQLDFVVFGNGARCGGGSRISRDLKDLRALRVENQAEFDALVSSSARYQSLSKMFPDWTDAQNLQDRKST